MTRKSLRSSSDTQALTIQKYRWEQKKSFDNFESADKLRNFLKEEGYNVKVKRHGPDGRLFKVVVGTEIKKNKKEKNNAAE